MTFSFSVLFFFFLYFWYHTVCSLFDLILTDWMWGKLKCSCKKLNYLIWTVTVHQFNSTIDAIQVLNWMLFIQRFLQFLFYQNIFFLNWKFLFLIHLLQKKKEKKKLCTWIPFSILLNFPVYLIFCFIPQLVLCCCALLFWEKGEYSHTYWNWIQ